MTEFLTLDDLLYLAGDIGVGPVRDVGLLESAAARPQTTLMGADAYPDLAVKAAALLHSLVCNHALADGNKRLGWLACAVFLDINGIDPSTASDDDVVNLIVDLAANALEIPEIATRLGAIVVGGSRSG